MIGLALIAGFCFIVGCLLIGAGLSDLGDKIESGLKGIGRYRH